MDQEATKEEKNEFVNSLNTCPVCFNDAYCICKCGKSHRLCSNGHHWVPCSTHSDKRIIFHNAASAHGEQNNCNNECV